MKRQCNGLLNLGGRNEIPIKLLKCVLPVRRIARKTEARTAVGIESPKGGLGVVKVRIEWESRQCQENMLCSARYLMFVGMLPNCGRIIEAGDECVGIVLRRSLAQEMWFSHVLDHTWTVVPVSYDPFVPIFAE